MSRPMLRYENISTSKTEYDMPFSFRIFTDPICIGFITPRAYHLFPPLHYVKIFNSGPILKQIILGIILDNQHNKVIMEGLKRYR